MTWRLPRVVLIDLDDTIVSFSSGKPDFWLHAFEQHASPADRARVSAVEFCQAIAEVQAHYWSDLARGHRGRMDLWRARREVAARAFERTGVADPDSAVDIADAFTRSKEEAVAPFEGAVAVLQQLRAGGHRLGLLTNGSSEFQRRKLERFQLEPLFELILVEGELGVGKPDPHVFQEALRILGVGAAEACMVGDNLRADIAGAQAQGIVGIWNDHADAGLPADAPALPHARIRHIRELLEFSRPSSPT